MKIIQGHHIHPDKTVLVFKGEHKILTLIQWYCKKSISKGFLKALWWVIRDNSKRAIALKKD